MAVLMRVDEAQNGWINVGAMQPTLGDDAVRGFRHMDPVPTHMRGWVWTHARPILIALGAQIEVVPAHSRSSTTGSQGSIFESCEVAGLEITLSGADRILIENYFQTQP